MGTMWPAPKTWRKVKLPLFLILPYFSPPLSLMSSILALLKSFCPGHSSASVQAWFPSQLQLQPSLAFFFRLLCQYSHVISITSVDQNWDLRKDARDESVEWLHPITLEKEVSVDIEVAAIVAANFSAKLSLDFLQIQVLGNVTEGRIAQVARVLTLATDIIDVLIIKLVPRLCSRKRVYIPVRFFGMARWAHCCNKCLQARKTKRSRYHSSSGSDSGNGEGHSPWLGIH